MEISIVDLAKLVASFSAGDTANQGPWKIGQAYLFRTVTHYHTGRLVEVFADELVIENAAWVADTGRFSEALLTGVLAEVEPMPGRPIIGRKTIIDACEWPHELPSKKK